MNDCNESRESRDSVIPHRVHLVGIGGMHMSAIARILLSRGHFVSGSDLTASPLTEALSALGAQIGIGPHDAASIGEAEFVVTTSAAAAENPELEEAHRRGLTVIKRAEMVARLMQGKVGVCVAGCHGKSTTSGLVAFILKQAGLDPTYLIGAEVTALGNNAAPGAGPQVVVEADEYDRAFLSYHPELALVTNVEPDHLDYYGTWEAVQEAFQGFVANVQPGGSLLLCADNAEALNLRSHAVQSVQVLTYGLTSDHCQADWQVTDLKIDEGNQTFTVVQAGQPFGEFTLALPGAHNLQNALGAIAMVAGLGLDAAEIARALAQYTGVRRRFESVGEAGGIQIIDDYAHHPTELAALAQAARSRFPNQRIAVCFQPHTYARTRYLLDGFRDCFHGFDRLFLLETYAAREAIADGMTAQQLAAELVDPPPTYAANPAEAVEIINADLRPGDVFFTAGAGDVDAVGRLVLERLVSAQQVGNQPGRQAR